MYNMKTCEKSIQHQFVDSKNARVFYWLIKSHFLRRICSNNQVKLQQRQTSKLSQIQMCKRTPRSDDTQLPAQVLIDSKIALSGRKTNVGHPRTDNCQTTEKLCKVLTLRVVLLKKTHPSNNAQHDCKCLIWAH